MSLIELIVGAGQKFFGHVSTTFFSLKQFRDAMSALACHDFADTTVEFTQRAVAVCA